MTTRDSKLRAELAALALEVAPYLVGLEPFVRDGAVLTMGQIARRRLAEDDPDQPLAEVRAEAVAFALAVRRAVINLEMRGSGLQ